MGRVVGFGLLAVLVLIGAALAWLYTPDKRRAGLEAVYATAPSIFLDLAGVRLHVRDTGPRGAPAVVMLHGFGSSLQTWDAWAADMERDHRVIRYDLPGFGLTGQDTGGYTDERGIAVLLALLDRLGVQRASVIGNSMGGRIAWRFAAAHPERMDRLVLISPDGFAGPDRAYGTTEAVPLAMRTLPYVLPSFMLRPMLEAAYVKSGTLTDAVYDRYRDMMLAPGVRRAIVDRMAQQSLLDPVPLLRSIEAPTLLLWGEGDRMIPFGNSADYLAALPHGELTGLPGVGHVPQEEAPETVRIVRAFLDRR
ncbi:MAG: alpha/beta fold hydrolase [Pseudomonadota bacterium]|nr:alpha/beta fold hydrolase [Pseudomonadota bacterium]